MTKKRFRLSMAALGLLAAFFMVLIAVLLAPTLASANKDGGISHPHGEMPDPGYPHGGPGGTSNGSAENWNAGDESASAFDTPFCVDGGVYPCSVLGDTDNAGDDGVGPHNYENSFPSGGNPQGGDDSSNGNGPYSPSFWGGNGAPGGGAGGAGDGGDQNGDKSDNGQESDKSGDQGQDDQGQDGDQTNPDDTIPALKITEFAPTDDDLPSDFVDPCFGDESCKTDEGPGPKDEETPITEIAVTEVPEPLTMSLFAVGLLGAASLRRRSRQA